MNYNYSKKYSLQALIKNKKAFLLSFRIWGYGDEFFDTFLPYPNIWKPLDDKSYLIAYLLEGFFLTNKNKKFLHDVIVRFIATFEKIGALRVEWIGWINFNYLQDKDIKYLKIFNLRDDIAIHLETKHSKKDYRVLELLASATEYKESDDAFFDWLRFKVYDFVKANGKNALTLDYCLELARIGYDIMGHKKGLSTPLCKAKAIYNWVMENYNPKGVNNWNYKRKLSDKELKMTRRERALSNAKAQYEKAHKKIISLVTGIFKDEYKKPNGSWNINKISKETGISRPTIYKHLRDEGLI